MNDAINIGDSNHEVVRSLIGFRTLSKPGLAVNSTTNTYTITIASKQTDDILTATIVGAAGTVTKTHTVVVGNADNDAVATAFAAQIDSAADVAATATGAVITVTAAPTTSAFTISVAVTKAVGTPTTTATVAQTIIGAKGIKTSNTFQYVLDGHAGQTTTKTNVALSGSVIPISSFCWFLAHVDTNGAVTTTQGTVGENMLPAIPANQTPIGAVKIVTNGSTTFTPGTTSLNATGITDTYYDLSCVPKAGYPA